jgi:hypothetical protein
LAKSRSSTPYSAATSSPVRTGETALGVRPSSSKVAPPVFSGSIRKGSSPGAVGEAHLQGGDRGVAVEQGGQAGVLEGVGLEGEEAAAMAAHEGGVVAAVGADVPGGAAVEPAHDLLDQRDAARIARAEQVDGAVGALLQVEGDGQARDFGRVARSPSWARQSSASFRLALPRVRGERASARHRSASAQKRLRIHGRGEQRSRARRKAAGFSDSARAVIGRSPCRPPCSSRT